MVHTEERKDLIAVPNSKPENKIAMYSMLSHTKVLYHQKVMMTTLLFKPEVVEFLSLETEEGEMK